MRNVKDYVPSKDPRLIDCKTECGNSECYARRYGLFAEKACPNFVEPKPKTNADRIRAMTDEELARWIADELIEPGYYTGDQGYKLWLGWLKQEDEDA